MSKVVASAAEKLATRTSRRSFLSRGSKILLGIVGGSVAALAAASPAYANCSCGFGTCSIECPSNCGSGNQARICYACNDCNNQRCCCTGITC